MWIEVQPVPGSGGRLVRPEPFGGTMAFRRPEMLVLVDHAWLGQGGEVMEPGPIRPLVPSAPFEAHLTLGHRCTAGCRGCYIEAEPDAEPDMDRSDWEAVLERLAALGVFHVALGGGESLSWDLLVALAERTRELGMTPNLSTAGLHLTPRVAERLRVFERVHLSLDDSSHTARLMGLKILSAYHSRVGVNCVVARSNIASFDSLFGTLRGLGVRDVELLRFKPVGRGAGVFDRMNPTPAQLGGFFPRVLRLARRHRLRVRLDCSFTPMVCSSGIRPERLVRTGLAGCVGGSWLVSVDGRGRLAGCSFDTAGSPLSWERLGEPKMMEHFDAWIERAPEPCASCRWLPVCRGGCHVVARHVTGSFFAPDPGCPRVAARQRAN